MICMRVTRGCVGPRITSMREHDIGGNAIRTELPHLRSRALVQDIREILKKKRSISRGGGRVKRKTTL